MFTLDIPDAHPQAQVVWMAQASVASQKTPPGEYIYNAQSDAKAASIKPDMTLVACQPPGYNVSSPEVAVSNYFYKTLKQKVDYENASVELIESTKKAPLSYYQNKDGRKIGWAYQGSSEVKSGVSNRPHGVDQATFLVTIKNLTTGKWMNIRLIDQIGLTSIRPNDPDKYADEDCGPIRRIGASQSSTDLTAWQRSAQLSVLIASAQQTLTGFTDFSTTALDTIAAELALRSQGLAQLEAADQVASQSTRGAQAQSHRPPRKSQSWEVGDLPLGFPVTLGFSESFTTSDLAQLALGTSNKTYKRKFAVCSPVLFDPVLTKVPEGGYFNPLGSFNSYLQQLPENRDRLFSLNYKEAVVRIIQAPKHSTLSLDTSETSYHNMFLAKRHDKDYFGPDKAVFEIEYKGSLYRMDYSVVYAWNQWDPEIEGPCNHRLRTVGIPEALQDFSHLELQNHPASWTSTQIDAQNQLAWLISAASGQILEIADLPTTSLGQTTGEGTFATITLDTNAAGHGWYVDPTPRTNTDEYLPTSNASFSQANTDSAAADEFPSTA